MNTESEAVKSTRLMILGLALACSAAAAQTPPTRSYPDRPLRLIVGNAPGSGNDIINRILAARMTEALGQQVVVDNRAGAGGTVAMEIGKKSSPDGYTLISLSTASVTIAPHIYKNLTYDPLRDYEYISLFAIMPDVLVVHPSQPVRTLKEFVAHAKSAANFNMASAGAGSSSHLSGTALRMIAGFESLHVPYKGAGPSVISVVSGESQWALTPAAGVLVHAKAGRLRAIAHSLPERSPLLGELPAIAETFPGFATRAWYGLGVPRGTPRPVTERLYATVSKLASVPEVQALVVATGAQVAAINTPAEFRRFVQEDIAKIGKVVRAAGLKAE